MFAGWTARTCPAAGPICQRSASTAGPSSLGYIVLGLALYKVYTLHQAGHTAAGLWAEFSANTAKKTTGSGKKKKQQTQRAGR